MDEKSYNEFDKGWITGGEHVDPGKERLLRMELDKAKTDLCKAVAAFVSLMTTVLAIASIILLILCVYSLINGGLR